MKCNECKGRKRIELFSGVVDCDACGGSGEIVEARHDGGPRPEPIEPGDEAPVDHKTGHRVIHNYVDVNVTLPVPPARGTIGALEAAIRNVPGVRDVRLECPRVGQVDAHVIGGDVAAVSEAIESVRPAGLSVCLEHMGVRWGRAVAPDGSAVAVKSMGEASVTFGPGSSRPKLTAEDLDTLASLGPCGAIDNLDGSTFARWEANAIVYRHHDTREIRPTTYGYGFMAAARMIAGLVSARSAVIDALEARIRELEADHVATGTVLGQWIARACDQRTALERIEASPGHPTYVAATARDALAQAWDEDGEG